MLAPTATLRGNTKRQRLADELAEIDRQIADLESGPSRSLLLKPPQPTMPGQFARSEGCQGKSLCRSGCILMQ
jgi:hypothetical protein